MPNLDTVKQLPAKSKAAIAVAGVAILAITLLMLQLAGAPAYATLASGLDPAETGKVTAVLDERGIPYELQANGTTVAVEKAALANARVAVAGAGVATGAGAGAGFELFDRQKLGASDFQNKVTFQRALEGEIARTISGVQGVAGAQVRLVLPEDELFSDEQNPATAAVMLENGADTLEAGSIRGMAQLVASSVKGLKTDNVTITDGAGQLLWPQGDGVSAGAAGTAGKQAIEGRYERQLEATLSGLLARTLGPDKAQVTVKADLNVDKTKRNELVYAKKGVPLKTSEERETLEGAGARAGGRSGTQGNIAPTYSAGAGGSSNYERETEQTDFGVNRTVTETQVAPGRVEGLQVALLVDKSVDPAAFTEIQRVVRSAAGVDLQRGDSFEAAQVAFAKPPAEPKAGPIPLGMLEQAKYVAVGVAALLFLLFMARHLRRREAEALAQPAWLTQIEAPTPLAALEAPTRQVELPEREPDFQLQTLDQLTAREPDRVAAQVKSWMSED